MLSSFVPIVSFINICIHIDIRLGAHALKAEETKSSVSAVHNNSILVNNYWADKKKVEKCRTEEKSFVGLTIGEKSYTVVHHKCMKENVVSSEISILNKVEMSFQMERHWTYFRTRYIVTAQLGSFQYPDRVQCTFPPAHWRLILLIHDFSLVIGDFLLLAWHRIQWYKHFQ